jgi:hypothetical protein
MYPAVTCVSASTFSAVAPLAAETATGWGSDASSPRRRCGSVSRRCVAEEVPLAHKHAAALVDAPDRAGLPAEVPQPEPLICIKG